MQKLLNTLYILSEDASLTLNGETVTVSRGGTRAGAFPLHTLQTICSFSRIAPTPALLGKCVSAGIQVTLFSPYGKYLASVGGLENGNVLLRRKQYRTADNEVEAVTVARGFLAGKLYNSKFLLLRCARDHAMQVNAEKLRKAAETVSTQMSSLAEAMSGESLRGLEGKAAVAYFGAFDEMLLQDKEAFAFSGRNKRPPEDPVNALLSFAYTLLANDCASALLGVGLDPYVGFLHTDRPGRKSLALDLMEELRSVIADRSVLYLINNRMLTASDFKKQESGAVLLTDDGRKTFLKEWQNRKQETLTHPFTGEKMPWGLVPHVQALLLARSLRGDLDGYPPFFWK